MHRVSLVMVEEIIHICVRSFVFFDSDFFLLLNLLNIV